MANELPDIKSRLVLDDSQIAEVLGKVGKQAESMGQQVRRGAEPARLAMWGLGESAENLAQSFGVPNQMSRQLSNTVERLASGLGMGAAAFGAVGIAAMATYGIYQQLNEQKKKLREETEKNIASLKGEVEQLYGGKIGSEGLTQANRNLLRAKRDLFMLEMEYKIQDERDAYKELQKKVDDFIDHYDALKKDQQDGMILTGRSADRYRDYEKQIKKVSIALKQIGVDEQYLKTLRGATEELGGITNEQYDAHLETYKAYLENRQYEAKKEFEWEQQIHDAVMEYDKAQIESARRAADARILKEQRVAAIREATAKNALNALVMGYQMAGQHSHKAFVRYRQFAKLQAGISTAEGAIAAYKAMAGIPYIGPALGAAAATALVFYGKQQIKAIDEAQPGGSPAMPTFNANPATGLPATGGGGLGNLTIIFKDAAGNNRDEIRLTEDVLKTLFANGGEVNGYALPGVRRTG